MRNQKHKRSSSSGDSPNSQTAAEGAWSGAIEQTLSEDPTDRFAAWNLRARTQRVLAGLGFEAPTEIQRRVIQEALAGRDIMGLAETGSGKTAAFVIPVVERPSGHARPRALMLSPTREIALQTQSFVSHFAPKQEWRAEEASSSRRGGLVFSACLIGGTAIKPQLDQLKSPVEIVVATPGRLLDHVERGALNLGGVRDLVMDEADHMLDLGFWPQIQRILRLLPEDRRTLMFSATMPDSIRRLADRTLRDPLIVDLRPTGQAADGIEHRLHLVREEDKKPALLALLHRIEGSTLVFTRRKIDAEWLARVLEREGQSVERIHSDRSQSHRIRALRSFREGGHRILVATDVAARGLDVPGISHIVNFDLPEAAEDYVHRAGRTARGSAHGVVSSIATWLDRFKVKEIESALGRPLVRFALPGVETDDELPTRRAARHRAPWRR